MLKSEQVSLLVDMYLDGYSIKVISKATRLTIAQVKYQIEHKGLNEMQRNNDYVKNLRIEQTERLRRHQKRVSSEA